jgi:hypothetical protein
MTEPSLEFISRQLDRVLDELRTLRRDVDMLTRIVLRVDSTVDALREDIKSLWLGQGDLRRRIEALEEARR